MRRNDTLNIYGSGPSLRTAEYPDGSEKWSVGTLFPLFGEKMDLYFCMHPSESVGHKYIGQNDYPLEDIVSKYGRSYFTNTISYMMAYAIFTGHKDITLYGVDVDGNGEYAFERPSITYWCGVAEANGIKVHWDVLEPCFMYGYDQGIMDNILHILEKHKQMAEAEFSANTDQRLKDQWAGYITAINKIIQEVRS